MNARIKKEDQLISEIMKDFSKSPPPEDFTAKVMERIELEQVTSVIVARPLISKAGWIVISILVIILMLIIFLSSEGEASSQSWISENLGWNFNPPQIDFEKLNFIDFSSSPITWIILGAGGIMLLALIQRWFEENKFRHTLFL
jgi:hypothetical protein